ncbi:hypothetical protein B0H16DRAFT_1522172 [Mycena metata]|uniref:Uncharacterized protein n=1 Tax=Mycena metata TaxID=1033252 RepID=A0AAD7NMN6_9AGAR|nr:hypothetical protein B0H16DRAFT_1522172 [Mycena metata]
METYLERSGQHPLTFRLAYSNETMHYQSFLECLNKHCARWQNVVIDSPDHRALEVLYQADPSDYPKLRSLVCSSCDFDHEVERSLGPIPWSQLQRYHEYECSWSPDSEHQWSIITQLTNVVDLQMEFYGDCAAFYSSGDEDSDGGDDESENGGGGSNNSDKEEVVELNSLQFASFAIHDRADDLDITQILDRLQLPVVQGLNLKLMPNHSPDLLSPMPAQLKGLKILRLCGSLVISNEALSCILTELEGLTDLAIELRGIRAIAGLDAMHLFTLLTPSHNTESVVQPKLQALRITEFELVDGVVDTLLAMLRQRFTVDVTDFTRLKRFELSSLKAGKIRYPLLDTLESMQVQAGWDIRIYEERQDFWRTDMTFEFL